MALTEDLKATVDSLVAEDGLVITALNDLLAKSQSAGTVTNEDVQAAVDTVKAEVAKLDAAVQADDPTPSEPTA